MKITTVTIIGAGTMGNGIAHVFAQAGYHVALTDVDANALDLARKTIDANLERMVKKEKITPEAKIAALQRITTYTSLTEAVKDSGLVVEAATENRELKRKIFQQLDTLCGPDVIFASNTSSISITEIAASTKRSSLVIGMHFMNPVPVMKLIEVIRGYDTSDEVTESILSISKKLDKTALVVNDYPGFVANRILMPMINEAIITLHEGVAGVTEIDTIMKLGMAHPMGPLELADFIGLDTCLAILRVLHDGLGNQKYAPCPLLVNMVIAGKLGKKSGVGFYNYASGSPIPTSSR